MWTIAADGVFVVAYRTPDDLLPANNRPFLIAAAAEAKRLGRKVSVVFDVSSAIRTIDLTVPGFWLGVTADPECPFARMAIVSTRTSVQVAARGFLFANRVRGTGLLVEVFDERSSAIAWAAGENDR